MKRFFTKRTICIGMVLLGFLFIVQFMLWNQKEMEVFSSVYRYPGETLIIDPGHGGEDGGAISISGKVESEINLSISNRLDALMGLYGIHTMMTRTEDISLHDPSAVTITQKKVSDIRNRVLMIESVDNATLISIHQNSYPQSKYRGMQVFYSNGELSKSLAETIQNTVQLSLDPNNMRRAMKIPRSVYLLNHVTCRAILVECGFLTNPEEDQLLQESQYQNKVAITLAASYLNFKNTQES